MIFSLLSPLPDSTCWPLVIQTRTILLLTRKPWNLEPSHFNSCQHVYFVARVCVAGEGRLEYPVNRLARELTIFSVGRNLVPCLLLHLLPREKEDAHLLGGDGRQTACWRWKTFTFLAPRYLLLRGRLASLPIHIPIQFLHHSCMFSAFSIIKTSNAIFERDFKY